MSKSAKRRKQAEKRRQEMAKLRGASSLLDDEASPMKPLESSPIPEKAKQLAQSYIQTMAKMDEHDDATEDKRSSNNDPVSTDSNGPDGLSTQRKQIEFVLPKANGKVERYTFDKQLRRNLKQELPSIPEVDTPLSTVVKPKQKKEESIDDILFPNKRQKLADKFEAIHQDDLSKQAKRESKNTEKRRHSEILPSGTQTSLPPTAPVKQAKKRMRSKSLDDAGKDMIDSSTQGGDKDMTNQRPSKLSQEPNTSSSSSKVLVTSASSETLAARSKLELVNRQLSGRSIEQAVRDKQGLRPRANSTDGELNLPQRGLCDEQMVLRSHQWLDPNFGRHNSSPRGFINLGNTCFLNSILQCLAYSPPFCQSLITISEMKIKQSQNGSKPKQNQGQNITAILSSLFQKLHGFQGNTTNANALAPQSIVKALPHLGSIGSRNGYKFWPGRQEDAHEFLVHLLDAMHDGELRAAGINQHSSGWRDRLPVSRLDETTFIHRIFGGYFRSQVRCRACGYCSNTYDPFLDLSLEVSKNSSNSILNALHEFTRKETLDADNQWKCSGCKKYVCPTKQLTVFRPPLSLCIQLKRFAFSGRFGGRSSFGGGGGWKHAKSFGSPGRSKITKPIEFPSDLDLPLSDGRSCAYSLTGVVIHVGGSASSGHYTACVKKPGKKGTCQWYYADDSSVQPVSETSVLKQKDAYILFYCRKEVKLEFPSPPPRDMSTEEAREFGRARARARADSNAAQEEPKAAIATVAVAERTRVDIHPLAELLNTTMSEQLRGTMSPNRTISPKVATPNEIGKKDGNEKTHQTSTKQALPTVSTNQPSTGNDASASKLLNSSTSEEMESSVASESSESDSEGEASKQNVAQQTAQSSPPVAVLRGNKLKTPPSDLRASKGVELTQIHKSKDISPAQPSDSGKKLSANRTPTPVTPRGNSQQNESSEESDSSDSDSRKDAAYKTSVSKTESPRGDQVQIESSSESDSSSDTESNSDSENDMPPKQTPSSGAESSPLAKAQNNASANHVPADRKSPQLIQTSKSGTPDVSPRSKYPAENDSNHSRQKHKSPHQKPTTPKEEKTTNDSSKGLKGSPTPAMERPQSDSESSESSSPPTIKSRESLNRTPLSMVASPKGMEPESDFESEDGIHMSTLTNPITRSTAKSPRREKLKGESSSESESSDSHSDIEVEEETPSHGARPPNAPGVVEGEKNRKKSFTKSDVRDTTPGKPNSLQKGKRQESNSNSKRNDATGGNEQGEGQGSETSQATPSKTTRSPAESKTERQSGERTRVVVGNEDSRGKVKVMLGPRKRNAWEPKVASVTQKGEAFQLLGNLSVSKWDDDQEEPKTGKKESGRVPLEAERALIVKKMVRQESSRKRKMHLDRWDALLDQGKTKKVKSSQDKQQTEKTDQPTKNVFQRIQSGIQKMNKGKAKGLFRRKSGEGSTMSNGRRLFRY